MKPYAWSHSALESFKNCPRSFHAQRVLKSVKQEPTQHTIWGEYVHKQFEDFQRDGKPLADDVSEHYDYMTRLAEKPGEPMCELKIALNTRLEPCEFFDPSVWFRGVIDFMKIHENRATIIDYKTGKPHGKFGQLKLFALHTFIAHPEVDVADVRFYWTKTQDESRKVFGRSEIDAMWKEFIPDLRQYAEAFKLDVWQPRPSGLCGWCPVKDCEFWRPRRY